MNFAFKRLEDHPQQRTPPDCASPEALSLCVRVQIAPGARGPLFRWPYLDRGRAVVPKPDPDVAQILNIRLDDETVALEVVEFEESGGPPRRQLDRGDAIIPAAPEGAGAGQVAENGGIATQQFSGAIKVGALVNGDARDGRLPHRDLHFVGVGCVVVIRNGERDRVDAYIEVRADGLAPPPIGGPQGFEVIRAELLA